MPLHLPWGPAMAATSLPPPPGLQVDAAVVEVGLGGTRDATNVLPAAGLAAAVITAVGRDHAAALGGTIEAIAAAKAGIMQAGRPVVLGRQPEAAAEAVLLRRGGCCAMGQADPDSEVPLKAWLGLPRRLASLQGVAAGSAHSVPYSSRRPVTGVPQAPNP